MKGHKVALGVLLFYSETNALLKNLLLNHEQLSGLTWFIHMWAPNRINTELRELLGWRP